MSSTQLAAQPSGAQYLGLVGLGAAIGIPGALLAALFLGFVHYLEGWLWDDLPLISRGACFLATEATTRSAA